MTTFTRRELLDVLAVALPCSLVACRSKALSPEETVCVHVYPESLAFPASLLEDLGVAPTRRPAVRPFTTGLPEIFVCTSSVPFLQLFPYFWPIASDELQRARNSIRVLFQVEQLSSNGEADGAERWLAGRSLPSGSVGVFTYNDFTRFFARRLLLAFRSARLSEVVVFKDPSVPPYLCDAPARQKRFRRLPP
jgi:hypothetical protein